jgi:hypothetical protein
MDFATYVDAIRDFASAEFSLYIPDPNENYSNEVFTPSPLQNAT